MYNPEQPVFEEQPESNIEIAYGIEDVPKPWWKAVLFALQITLVDFTPFMWAAGFASLAGIDQPDFVPTLLCACFFCMGICTFLQTTVGNRLPIVQGSSSALMSSMGNIAAVYGLPAVWGASLIGGLIQTILGITKTVSKVRAFLPPVVVGSVVTAIGFVAARIAVQWTFSRQEPLYLVLALISFLLALILKFKTKGMVSQGFILITVVIVGVVVSSFLGIFDWNAVYAAPWIKIPRLLAVYFLHTEYRHCCSYRRGIQAGNPICRCFIPVVWLLPENGIYSCRNSETGYWGSVPDLCGFHYVFRN